VNQHTSKQFDVEMEAIRSGVLLMGGLVETQIARAIAALESPDVDLIDAVATDELAINHMQVDLDQQCSQIIARRQPTAIDLRMVLTVVKVVNELERIGDEIKKIAYKAQQMQRPEGLSNVRFHEITRAAKLAEDNLQLALDAFARLDVRSAAQVISNDEALDAAFLAILRQLISYMMEDPRTITAALEIVFIAKSIERIGDHAKNIAENVVHVVKGKDVRHATAEQIRAEVAE
jgi:phosphate transport system protein